VSDGRLLLANIGAEEGADWRRRAEAPPLRALARLWRGLFEPPDLDGLPAPEAGPAFDWLPGPEAAAAWLVTEEAEREAERAGRALWGAPASTVRAVHDKAFALAVAEREGLTPEPLRGLAAAFAPEDLADPAAATAALAERLRAWPAWARRSFTLKPRFGSSGRGRVAGSDGQADTASIRGALPRLAACGGAVLEPWLERREDLSAQLWLAPDGGLRVVGTSRPQLAASGLYRGQRGTLDPRGRVGSGSRHDEALREAAARVARAAHAAGFHGACGLDAFAFALPPAGGEALRPVVEWNARFTVGHVAIGWARRARARAAAGLGLAPGEPCHFHFALDAPPGGWPEGPGLSLVPLWDAAESARPALLFASRPEALARGLGGGS
jgi:hypothetical protein